MAGGIYLRREGELVRMNEQLYATEAYLQELLANHPDLLSADGDPHRWLLISREFGIAAEDDASDRWSVDHLFIDEEAIPTLVEVKRSTDTRMRREVVGQMLDYAANALSHWKVEPIRARFEAECEGDPQAAIAAALGDDINPDEFWKRVETNLAAGRLRLMFVADSIPSELRAIVEFLNQHMPQVDVLALELKQYVDEEAKHQTLVPRLIGETQAARQAKGRRERTTWDRESWLAAYRELQGEREAGVVEQLLDWADQHDPALTVSFGATRGAGAKVRLEDVLVAFTIYPGFAGGYLEIPFGALASTPAFEAFERRQELQRRLSEIPQVSIRANRLDKFPSIPIIALTEPIALHAFIATIEWVVRDVLAAMG